MPVSALTLFDKLWQRHLVDVTLQRADRIRAFEAQRHTT